MQEYNWKFCLWLFWRWENCLRVTRCRCVICYPYAKSSKSRDLARIALKRKIDTCEHRKCNGIKLSFDLTCFDWICDRNFRIFTAQNFIMELIQDTRNIVSGYHMVGGNCIEIDVCQHAKCSHECVNIGSC